MIVQVQAEKCAGCSACESVCPSRAISLVDYIAVIDPLLCDGCQKCISICPQGAIAALAAPLERSPLERMPVYQPVVQEPEIIKIEPAPARPLQRLGSTLADIGLAVLPRLADLLVTKLEEKQLANTGKPGGAPLSTNLAGDQRGMGRGMGRGMRRRQQTCRRRS